MGKERQKKSQGAKNKNKGSHAERFYAKLFRELGFSHCVTARMGSRLHDNAGIDIMNIPINVQIKAGIQKGLNAGKVLFQMESQIKALFPPTSEVRKYSLVVVHRPEAFSSNTDKDIIYMSMSQYLKYKEVNGTLKYETIKTRKEKMESEFATIVGMSFNSFKEKIIKTKYVKNSQEE